MVRHIDSLAEVSDLYDAIFCDLWGCLHNGLHPFEQAVAACRAFRDQGGTVVLVTNAPRQRAVVERQLDRIGVDRDCWDTIATSGDSARAAMFRGAAGTKVWFMGEPRDRIFFEPMKLIEDPAPIEVVDLDAAEGIVCCGPFDPHADPSVLRPELLLAKTRGLPLLCANPDIVVDMGDERIWCAGAVARLYTEMGGESLYFGKPHPPVYDLARRRMAELGRDVRDGRILAIGDGIRTDILGAQQEDIDSLFITGGLAADEIGDPRSDPGQAALGGYLAREQITPTYVIEKLR